MCVWGGGAPGRNGADVTCISDWRGEGVIQGYFYQISNGGHLRFWTFKKKQISDLLKKLWTFQYAAGFRGPGILIKRSTIVDLSVYAAWLRGPDISQNIQQILKKYPKIDYLAFASSRRHYAADNRTARDIQNFGPFWVVKIQGGAMPPWPP